MKASTVAIILLLSVCIAYAVAIPDNSDDIDLEEDKRAAVKVRFGKRAPVKVRFGKRGDDEYEVNDDSDSFYKRAAYKVRFGKRAPVKVRFG